MQIGAGSEGFEGESQGPVLQEAEEEEARQEEAEIEAPKEAEVEVAQPRQPETGTQPAKSLSFTEASHTDATRPMPSSQVVGSQPTQLHTQAIHSTTSQQVVVSSEHGALPPIPSFTRLDSIGVETRVAHPQHSPSFMSLQRVVLWMKIQLADYGYTMHRIPIYCDSSSAIQIAANPVQHSRTKHIDIRYHFIKDHVEKGNVELFFVESERQIADLFTKAFDEKRHYYLLSKLGMLDPPADF
ncbi:hypothetical protein OSB04_031817 [Centaurea solstitialis]|uniref:Retrotransposon protein, putative, unclassified n=1 Tax=Centaurea solstitialis TaxID=347529 RepID=A0AA38S9Q6_9ASTR|nr:hypothetical protein OSB04_031817 [Centaurea solstitialis]